MNQRVLYRTLLPGVLFLLAASCAPRQSVYVDPTGSRLVTSVESINIQDFSQAADAMTQSLVDNLVNQDKLESGAAGQPALIAISQVQNKTSQALDTDLLVKKIRVALNRTGRVQTSTTMSLGGPEDPLAAEQQKMNEFFEDRTPSRRPDYTLSGKIIEVREQAGKTRQVSFVFQLSLSSSAGIAVWEEEKTIVKQGRGSSVGY